MLAVVNHTFFIRGSRMNRHVEVRSIREGVYILWYLGYTDLASLYASGSERELLRFNGAINRLIEQNLTENDKSEIIQNFLENQGCTESTVLMKQLHPGSLTMKNPVSFFGFIF